MSIVSRNQQVPGSLAVETTLWACRREIDHSSMPFKVFEASIVVCALTHMHAFGVTLSVFLLVQKTHPFKSLTPRS